MSSDYLGPGEIVDNLMKGLLAERSRLAKWEVDLPALRRTVRRAERFIRQMCETWNLSLPLGFEGPSIPVPVTTHPRPEGITVVKSEFICPEDGFQGKNKQSLAMHRYRAHEARRGP